MNYNMNILINGKSVEHNLGDSMWYITTDENNKFSLIVKEFKDYVQEIKITADGIEFTDSDGTELSEEAGEFWSKEEAEMWIEKNVPKDLSVFFNPNEDIFTIKYGKIEIWTPDEISVRNGGLQVRFASAGYSSRFFTLQELTSENVFDSYDEAKRALREKEIL